MVSSSSPASGQRFGVLMVVSGPSGSGKSTLCRKLSDAGEAIFSISCTTRSPRPGEMDGKDYFFLSEEEFVRRIEAGDFFEHACVHGRRYGSLKSYVTDNLRRGVDVMMDIDVQGAALVRACEDEIVRRCYVDVFILLSSDELQQRLAGRGTETQEAVDLRLGNAIAEMEHWPAYQHVLVSSSREADFDQFRSLLLACRMRTSLQG